jgi:hypothetical protein
MKQRKNMIKIRNKRRVTLLAVYLASFNSPKVYTKPPALGLL